jgi:hypothetical protein
MDDNNFCKVFQIDENHQVLYQLVIIEDSDDEQMGIEMKTFINGVQLKATMSGFKDKTPEQHLKTVSLENANNWFNHMKKLFE